MVVSMVVVYSQKTRETLDFTILLGSTPKLDFTILLGSTPTFLYFDLYLYTAYGSTLHLFHTTFIYAERDHAH